MTLYDYRRVEFTSFLPVVKDTVYLPAKKTLPRTGH